MNIDEMILAPVYRSFGTDAVLTLNQTDHTIRVIDQTTGIEVDAGGLSMPSIKPAAAVRASLLTDLEISQDQLLDATLAFNGETWTVKNVREKPGAAGRSSGELQLILINGDL